MAKVILQISYDVDPEKRAEYLELVKEMTTRFREIRRKNYTVFEQKGKKNSFVEQFICNSMEEYDALEDDLDEKSEELVNRLEAYLKNGKAKYVTLLEVDS
ncbi:MAG: hypothetical protein FJ217_05550 [Ignavibacteria bacterium]|nr:hypothetical protein [Ignavibacteria bacterium]